ncbi:uncharacterized protein LOC106662551 [Cimex lectularius]|uniref:Uncharacterized protein n=1 Tax=Cimex lectularius TaxID=79782 RepID=A0A8I6RCP0_CIMLE|nr:uncharacterized protein LOC106662551 [Cimex lectularius]
MPPSPPPINTTYPHIPNNTYFTSDQDEVEQGFTDLQTVLLACFIILLPLMVGLVSYFCIKLLNRISRRLARIQRMPRPNFISFLRRFRVNVEPSGFGKTIDKESAERNKSSHALLNDQLKASESQFSVIPVEDGEDKSGTTTYAAGGNQTSKSTANGSIITMTMKNNHLIVETEERVADAVGDPSAESSGVFVVEVEPNMSVVAATQSVEPDDAIVHNVLPEAKDEAMGVNTGLSQSDLSCSSHGSCYRDFTYGTQQEYTGETDFTQLVCHIVASAEDDTYLDKQHPYLLNDDSIDDVKEGEEEIPKDGEENAGFVATPAEPIAPDTTSPSAEVNS